MPATHTLEQLIAYLKTKPSPFDMVRNIPLIVEGLEDLANRLHTTEADRLTDLDRMQKLESLTTEEKQMLDSVANDRTALQKQVADLSARLDALEKAKAEPVKPEPQPNPLMPPPASPSPLAQPAPAG